MDATAGPRPLGSRAASNRRLGRIVAALIIAATLLMWWTGRGYDDSSCTTFGATPQNASLTTLGETPVGCTG